MPRTRPPTPSPGARRTRARLGERARAVPLAALLVALGACGDRGAARDDGSDTAGGSTAPAPLSTEALTGLSPTELADAFAGAAPDAPTSAPADPPLGAAHETAAAADGSGGVPALEIGAERGALIFRWSAPPPDTRRLRLLAHDARDGTEAPLELELGADAREARLPVAAHRVAWDALSFRLEACGELDPSAPRDGGADGCVRSARTGVVALAGATFGAIVPPVTVRGERLGEAIALSADGASLALSAPLAGDVALYFTAGDAPRPGARLPVPDPPSPSRRALQLALSGDGDTLAVLREDIAVPGSASVGVLVRLGEGWIETARFAAHPDGAAPDAATAAVDGDGGDPLGIAAATRAAVDGRGAPGAAAAAKRVVDPAVRVESTTLLLSEDGERLLVARRGAPPARVSVHELDPDGWRHRATLVDDGDGTLLGVTASASLERVFVVLGGDGGTPRLRTHARERGYRAGTTLALDGLGAPLALASDRSGERLAVGARDAAVAAPSRTRLRRYRLPDDAATGLALEDALELPPTASAPTALALVADASLTTLALAWRGADDAGLHTAIADRRGRWRRALALPADATTLAKGALGTALAMSADGSTLALGAVAPEPGTAGPRAARTLLLAAERAGTLGAARAP